jgi:hypothetical protein
MPSGNLLMKELEPACGCCALCLMPGVVASLLLYLHACTAFAAAMQTQLCCFSGSSCGDECATVSTWNGTGVLPGVGCLGGWPFGKVWCGAVWCGVGATWVPHGVVHCLTERHNGAIHSSCLRWLVPSLLGGHRTDMKVYCCIFACQAARRAARWWCFVGMHVSIWQVMVLLRLPYDLHMQNGGRKISIFDSIWWGFVRM